MFLQRALWHRAHHSIYYLSTLKEEQGRNTGNAVTLGDGRVVIDVEFAHLQLARVLRGHLLDRWGNKATWAAPGGPEVDQHWGSGLQYFRLEIACCNGQRFCHRGFLQKVYTYCHNKYHVHREARCCSLRVRVPDVRLENQLSSGPLRKIGDGPGRAGQLQDMQPGIGTIDNVDITAVVDLDVIGLNRHLAGFPTAGEWDTALVGLRSDRRDIKSHFLGVVRVTDIHSSDAGVEVGDEHQAPIVDGRKRLVAGV